MWNISKSMHDLVLNARPYIVENKSSKSIVGKKGHKWPGIIDSSCLAYLQLGIW